MKKVTFILWLALILFSISSCETTKEKSPVIDYMIVNPNPIAINRGSYQDFSVIVHGTNNPPQTVTWSISGHSSSSTSINSSGRLSVASGETANTITVVATSTYDTGKMGVATATILQPSVENVVVSPNSVTIGRGQTQDFAATVNGSNNPPQTVTWSITGNSSSSTTISSSGRLSVASGETAHTITVMATSTFDTGKMGTATVIIIQPEYTTFGGIVWQILCRDTLNNRILIITRDIMEQRSYHTSGTAITWENSSLRDYLNGTFYDTFSVADRARIYEVTNENPNNPTYGTSGGNPTQDRIFLLSIAEAQQYFHSNADRVATFNGSASWWWLRSPGIYNFLASDVDLDGYFFMIGFYVNHTSGGVRPALWLNL